jgi:hypothetical protein
MKRFIYFLSIFILAAACREVYNAPPQAFAQGSILNPVYMDSARQVPVSSTFTIQGIGVEKPWIKDSTGNAFLIPLWTNDTAKFVMTFDAVTDTVSVIHRTTMKYGSMETGFYYEYQLKALKYTHHRIDSLIISDSLATINWHENIKFYLRALPTGGN